MALSRIRRLYYTLFKPSGMFALTYNTFFKRVGYQFGRRIELLSTDVVRRELEFKAATDSLSDRDRAVARRLKVDLPPAWGGVSTDGDGSICARIRPLNRRGEPRNGHMQPMEG